MKIIGTPSINKTLFYVAKFSIVGNIVFVFLKDRVHTFEFSLHVQLLALFLLFIAGALVTFISIANLGKSTRIGLPEEETQLKTHGLYAYSRNPIYLGVFMLCTASCIYVPHWLNLLFLLLVVVIHHRIILAEEKFLENKFKDQWFTYKSHVRRYL